MAVKTVNQEAKYSSQVFSDIDFYRRWYSLKSDDEIPVRFVSPALDAYEQYRYVLLKNSRIRRLTSKYYYRPDYVSYEEYGTTNFWSMLLFINDIPTIEQFDKLSIIVPTIGALDTVITEMKRNRMDLEIVPLSIRELSNTPLLYNSKVPEVIVEKTDTADYSKTVSATLDYIRDRFVLDSTDVLRRYVDLSHVAIVESVKLIIPGETNYLYGKHYKVIKGDSGLMTRLTWDSRKVSSPKLMDVMREKLSFDVTYVDRKNP